MSTNLPLGDYVRIALVTGVVLVLMALMASWLIDNALLPALRRVAGPVLRPWSERRWPAGGDHRYTHPLDEEETDGAMAEDLGGPVPDVRGEEGSAVRGEGHDTASADGALSEDQAVVAAREDDLTDEPGDEWPDALHDLNEEHLVKPHEPDLDDLDRRIEAARQTTTADPALFRDIIDALGFESTALWEDHAWATVRGLAVGTA